MTLHEEQSSEAEQILSKAIALAEQGDSFQAAQYLQRQGPPLEVAEHYSNLLRKLYFEKKDVPRMIMLGRAGIHYALDQAEFVAQRDQDLSFKLKGVAKEIAYNLGTNAWPGWQDEGIVITARDMADGLDAARLNLRLAGELMRDDEVHGNACWLAGAQLLAARMPQSAVEQFQQATRRFRAAGKAEYVQMASGYWAIASMCTATTRQEGEQQLAKAVKELQELGTEDAIFFEQQLKTVRSMFVP